MPAAAMAFVIVGVLLTVLKALDVGPVAAWSWLWVLLPYVLALAWWLWSDSSGRTRRLQMDKMDARKAERRRKNMENLGLQPKGGKGGKPR
jgi:small Trp-rich protein